MRPPKSRRFYRTGRFKRRCRTGKTGKKRSGEAREILETEVAREVRAGGARKILENAAVLERLEKNGAKFFIRSWWIVHEGF